MPAMIPTPRFPTLFGRATLVHDQHARLRSTLRTLREFCAEIGDHEIAVDRLLPGFVGELRRSMLAHFAAEESDQYFGTLATDFPSLQAEISRLLAEHRQIAETLEELETLAAGRHCIGDLRSCLERLVDRFHSHERAETRLIQEYLLGDERARGQ